MSKSRQPSAAASPSASASSHEPHSLPPNSKGVVQRYLAVSLPTVTFSQELIEVLDRAGMVIPSRIKVTMRWWKEDASSSLSVYPNINGSLPPTIEAHQLQLRQEEKGGPRTFGSRLQTQTQQPLQTQDQTLCKLQKSDLQSQTRPSSAFADTPASTFPSKKPWVGARFLNALRRRKGSPTKIRPPQPHAPPLEHVHSSPTRDAIIRKPLPMLPPAAFPLTVAYPVRCSLEKLSRYFQEPSVLTLEIHITPDLVASSTIPNLSNLFHNINGTFSGVFPFTHIAKNTSASHAHENLLLSGIALGMVVFQAWAQDTSQVSETSEESESASTASIPLPQHRQTHSFSSRHSLSQGQEFNASGERQDPSRQLHPSEGHSRDPLLLDHYHQSPPLLSEHPVNRHYCRHVIEEMTRRSRNQKVTIPEPEIDFTADCKGPPKRPQTWVGDSLPYENRRKSQDTHRSNVTNSQTSRSRPRSGATAAAIGRLDAVLSRGQDLLQGMKTSLALDPTEVRTESSKPPHSTVHNDRLPYWPSKSRFILELAIPTAYLTTHGLMKGSGRSTGFRQHHHGRRRYEKDPCQPPVAPRFHSTGVLSPKEIAARSMRRSAAPLPFEVAFPSPGQPTEMKTSTPSLHKLSNRSENLQRPLLRPQVLASHPDPKSDLLQKSTLHPPPTLRQSSSHSKHISVDTSKSQKRRLSSNDRLQIRMNPRAGELFADLPDLFSTRNMSALLRPEYPSSSEGSHGSRRKGSKGSVASESTESSSHTSSRFSERRRLSGRQSRLQKRPAESSANRKHETARDRWTNAYSKASKMTSTADPVHAQHFNFKAQCPLALTPEIMAACMLENISVELWKLNHKRQTMIELGTAELPLHQIIGRIIQKDVSLSNLPLRDNMEPVRRPSRAQRRRAYEPRLGKDCGPCKEGWRLEPSLYDIRSRHGTVIGQLDADIWVHPRSVAS